MAIIHNTHSTRGHSHPHTRTHEYHTHHTPVDIRQLGRLHAVSSHPLRCHPSLVLCPGDREHFGLATERRGQLSRAPNHRHRHRVPPQAYKPKPPSQGREAGADGIRTAQPECSACGSLVKILAATPGHERRRHKSHPANVVVVVVVVVVVAVVVLPSHSHFLNLHRPLTRQPSHPQTTTTIPQSTVHYSIDSPARWQSWCRCSPSTTRSGCARGRRPTTAA